jgi:predicted Rossmann fold flavoprotein
MGTFPVPRNLCIVVGMHTNESTTWDVIVVGAGPAGMMAAGRAAELGTRVLLLEKNPDVGAKLLITGGGRCNVTNDTPNPHHLLPRYGDAEQFLYSPFAEWDTNSTLKFFHERHMPTILEAEGRVFPQSQSARSVWEVMRTYATHPNVTLRTSTSITGLLHTEGHMTGVATSNGTYQAKKIIMATGGTSRPETGSTGEGFLYLASTGHAVAKQESTLVPVAIKDAWVKSLSGLAFSDIKISVLLEGKEVGKRRGKVLFTHFGLSGPAILNISSVIGRTLAQGDTTIMLDLLPEIAPDELNLTLRNLLRSESNKQIKNVLSTVVPSTLVSPLLELSEIPDNRPCHSVTREERLKLATLMKRVTITPLRLMGFDMAVVSGGGIPLTEVDTRTMESRIVKGLYIIGDLLNIDRPSGGYSLQLCWTTGFVAGQDAGEKRNT